MLDITKWRCGVFETTVALMPLRPAVQHASVTMFCASSLLKTSPERRSGDSVLP